MKAPAVFNLRHVTGLCHVRRAQFGTLKGCEFPQRREMFDSAGTTMTGEKGLAMKTTERPRHTA